MNRSNGEADPRHRLFGKPFTPIYVYAPQYVRWSAGIRALHYLCHALNENGFHAWLALHGPLPKKSSGTNPQLNTPVLTKRIIQDHENMNMASVGVYPESVAQNPLVTSVTVRWILNIPGLLGGSTTYGDDFKVAYSKYIGDEYEKHSGEVIPVLFLPVLDTDELTQTKEEKASKTDKYSLLYYQKFRALGGVPRNHGPNVIEIARFGKNAQTRSETLKLLANAEELIVYENSTIISEAQFLDVPVRCISNEWFSALIAEAELGSDGVMWDEAPKEAALTPVSVLFQDKLNLAIEVFLQQLPLLAEKWELLAEESTYTSVKLPSHGLVSSHTFYRSVAMLRAYGIIGFLRFAKNYLVRSIRK